MLRCRARAHPARLSPCAPAAHRRRPVRARAGGCAAAPLCAGRVAWSCSRARGRTGCEPHVVPGAGRRRRRASRSGSLNLAWHRLEWPPVERFAGAGRRRPLGPSAAAAGRRRAVKVVTIHDLDFLDHPGTDARRDPARLPGPRGAPRAARRPGRRDLGAHRPRGPEPPRRRAERIVVCRPGAPPPSDAPRSGPARARSCSSARSSRGRTCRRSLPPTSSWSHAQPGRPAARSGGRRRRAVGRRSSAACARAPALAGRVDYRGYVSDAERQALYAEASMLVLPSLDEGFGMTAVEAMQAGVPVVASTARRAAGGGRRRRASGRSGRRGRASRRRSNGCWQIRPSGGAAPRPGARRRALFSWTASAATLLDAYREALRAGGRRADGWSRRAENRRRRARDPRRYDRRRALPRRAAAALDRAAGCGRSGSSSCSRPTGSPLPLPAAHVRRARAARRRTRHLVGTDAPCAARWPRAARRLLRPGLHRAARLARASGAHDPRRLVPRAPRMVPAARGAAAPLADAALGREPRRSSSPTRCSRATRS